MCGGGEEGGPSVDEVFDRLTPLIESQLAPTEEEKAQLSISQDLQQWYKDQFLPVERRQYQTLDEDLSAYGITRASAEAAQGTMLDPERLDMSRGTGLRDMDNLARARAGGLASGFTQAVLQDDQRDISQRLKYLSQLQGLQGSTAQLSGQAAGNAASAASSVVNAAIDAQYREADAALQRRQQAANDRAQMAGGLGGLVGTGIGLLATGAISL